MSISYQNIDSARHRANPQLSQDSLSSQTKPSRRLIHAVIRDTAPCRLTKDV